MGDLGFSAVPVEESLWIVEPDSKGDPEVF